MSSSVHLRYGHTGLAVTLPPQARPVVIAKEPLAKLADAHGGVRHALDHPVGARAISELVRGRTSACILVCDITRPVPNRLFLRPMIEAMLAAGEEMIPFNLAGAKADDAELARVYAAAGIEVTPLPNDAVDAWQRVARDSAWKIYAEKTKLAAQMLKMAQEVPV